MMIPSAAPMILLYARVGCEAEAQGQPFASTFWFAGGYLLAWTGFSLVASAVQSALVQTAMITPTLASANTLFGGIVLVAAGLYQGTPLKFACLSHCQSPLFFIHRHGLFKREALASLRLGLAHGLYCIGCCWALMALLFVGGVMNVLWVAVLAILVLVEKVLPKAWFIPRGLGLVLIAAGLIFLYRTIL
jgi:predicted metal-binding membrane protein